MKKLFVLVASLFILLAGPASWADQAAAHPLTGKEVFWPREIKFRILDMKKSFHIPMGLPEIGTRMINVSRITVEILSVSKDSSKKYSYLYSTKSVEILEKGKHFDAFLKANAKEIDILVDAGWMCDLHGKPGKTICQRLNDVFSAFKKKSSITGSATICGLTRESDPDFQNLLITELHDLQVEK